jgi:hypothetical protein
MAVMTVCWRQVAGIVTLGAMLVSCGTVGVEGRVAETGGPTVEITMGGPPEGWGAFDNKLREEFGDGNFDCKVEQDDHGFDCSRLKALGRIPTNATHLVYGLRDRRPEALERLGKVIDRLAMSQGTLSIQPLSFTFSFITSTCPLNCSSSLKYGCMGPAHCVKNNTCTPC